MSQIATFHVIAESSLPAIWAAAQPEKSRWFRKPKDRFSETLNSVAPDVLNLAWSGYTVILLSMFLKDRGIFDFDKAAAHPFARSLFDASKGLYFAAFSHDVAAALEQQLSSSAVSASDLSAYVRTALAADVDMADVVASLRAALNQVREGTLGLLHVG